MKKIIDPVLGIGESGDAMAAIFVPGRIREL
jgi:hypothetical protein